MAKYFGTDGARGKANEKLTLEMATKMGQYLGWYYSKKKHAKIVIGKDTRLSSDMFELALASGALSCGANVYLLDVTPTPAVSYLVKKEKFDCGIMISASHNPYYDNGIKLFDGNGCKMNPIVEEEVEEYIDNKRNIEMAYDDHIGHVVHWDEGIQLYESWLKSIVPLELSGFRIALDLANGSATSCAIECLRDMGAYVDAIHNAPNGVNINEACGSTHPEALQDMMKSGKYDVGFAFDGDADRLIAIDEHGQLINGDYTMYICGKYLKDNNKLKDNVVVTTVMSNLGLYHAFDKAGIKYEQTAVGDKYVFECMKEHDYNLGGEQSGHVIFYEYHNTGDGLLSALKLLEVMSNTKKSLTELGKDLFIYPQLLVNINLKDKEAALNNQELKKVILNIENILGDEGRVLVRPSGTEQLLRIMVEAKTVELCEKYVNEVVDFMKEAKL